METQRVYEINQKDMESELQAKTNKLNQTAAQKRQMKAETNRKIIDHKRQLETETQRKLARAEEANRLKEEQREAKMDRLKVQTIFQHSSKY